MVMDKMHMGSTRRLHREMVYVYRKHFHQIKEPSNNTENLNISPKKSLVPKIVTCPNSNVHFYKLNEIDINILYSFHKPSFSSIFYLNLLQ